MARSGACELGPVNGNATFRSLGGLAGVGDKTKQSTDAAAHDCTQPDLPPVNIPSGTVVTNFASSEAREKCRRLGASAFFDKSRELEELFDYLLMQRTAACTRP